MYRKREFTFIFLYGYWFFHVILEMLVFVCRASPTTIYLQTWYITVEFEYSGPEETIYNRGRGAHHAHRAAPLHRRTINSFSLVIRKLRFQYKIIWHFHTFYWLKTLIHRIRAHCTPLSHKKSWIPPSHKKNLKYLGKKVEANIKGQILGYYSFLHLLEFCNLNSHLYLVQNIFQFSLYISFFLQSIKCVKVSFEHNPTFCWWPVHPCLARYLPHFQIWQFQHWQ